MRTSVFVLGLWFLGLWMLALPALAVDPLQLYGDSATYSVERKGKPIGHYRLDFSRSDAQTLEVAVEMALQIRVLGLFRYDYRYRANEVWQGADRLSRLDVRINDDGEARDYRFQRREDGLYRLEPGRSPVRLGDRLLTSNHWHPHLVRQSELLNTLTGEVSSLNVELQAREALQIGGESVMATRYRLGGELNNTLSWYDEQGRWLGMEFSARDGSRIRVRLRPDTEHRHNG
ncbi:DUF6134 family protein [Marinobacterium weihaiense]|uniref:DUF3108 domain-containing protein n=1 Tax=Marinobacterium weihaiense TaxID=2851016 RepID=A0ABS6M9Q8_9GAMM|nr:DUF6134 family protein [Marinobacterium weihaiense]MBV0933018.1 hypothetical protein [Marinobacterium weihaiense]